MGQPEPATVTLLHTLSLSPEVPVHLSTHVPTHTHQKRKPQLKLKPWHAELHHPTPDPHTTPPHSSRVARSSTQTRARGRASCARRYSRPTSCRGTSTSSRA